MKEEIGKRICDLRRSLNLNKEQFSKLMGVSAQYLGTVEAGVNCFSVSTLINLCKNTNVSADYILFGKENISDEKLHQIFNNIDESQIYPAFETLEKIALFITSYKEKADGA